MLVDTAVEGDWYRPRSAYAAAALVLTLNDEKEAVVVYPCSTQKVVQVELDSSLAPLLY